jgi:hypothetical protein
MGKHDKNRGHGGTLPEEELQAIVDPPAAPPRPDPGVDTSEQTARDVEIVDKGYSKRRKAE